MMMCQNKRQNKETYLHFSIPAFRIDDSICAITQEIVTVLRNDATVLVFILFLFVHT